MQWYPLTSWLQCLISMQLVFWNEIKCIGADLVIPVTDGFVDRAPGHQHQGIKISPGGGERSLFVQELELFQWNSSRRNYAFCCWCSICTARRVPELTGIVAGNLLGSCITASV